MFALTKPIKYLNKKSLLFKIPKSNYEKSCKTIIEKINKHLITKGK